MRPWPLVEPGEAGPVCRASGVSHRRAQVWWLDPSPPFLPPPPCVVGSPLPPPWSSWVCPSPLFLLGRPQGGHKESKAALVALPPLPEAALGFPGVMVAETAQPNATPWEVAQVRGTIKRVGRSRWPTLGSA